MNDPTSRPSALRILILLTFLALPAAAAPPSKGLSVTFSKSFAPSTIGPGSTSTLTFTISNPDPTQPRSELAFTDNLPAGVTIATPAQAVSSCGGILSAPDGGTTITFGGGVIAAASICTITVDVTSATPGVHMNVSGDLTSDAGNHGPASADLTVDTGRPGFTKSFSPSSVSFGGRSTLTFTIDNSLNGGSATFLTFTDTLPPGMVVAVPSNAVTDCDFSSTPVVTAVPGTNFVSLPTGPSSGGVDAGNICTVSVDVIGGAVGSLGNTSGDLRATVGSTKSCGKASAELTVTGFANLLSLEKEFTDDPVAPGGTVTLEFTVTNRSRTDSATNITFSDDLDATLTGLVPTLPPSPDPPCGGGSSLGFSLGAITLTGGNLPPSGFCTFSVSLSVPASATPGAYPNSAGPVSGDVGGSPEIGNTAGDLLFVAGFPILTKEFTDDPVGAGGTVTLEFTITNSSSTSSATDIAFTDVFDVILPTASATPGSGFCNGTGTSTFTALINPPPPASTIPAQLTISGASLVAGASCTFSITLDVAVGAAPGTYVNTTSAVTATVDGATQVGKPASDALMVVAAPHLSKEFTDDPAIPGGTVTLEFTLENPNLADAASAIAFSDNLTTVLAGLTASSVDTNTCTGATVDISAPTLIDVSGGTLAAGASCTITLTLTLPAGPLPGAIFPNTTSAVTATVAGLTAMSPAARDDLVATGLLATMEFTDDPVIAGGTGTLTFTYVNTAGAGDATSITFLDPYNPDVLSGLVATLPPVPDPPCGAGSSLAVVNPAGPSVAGLELTGGNVLAGASCSFSVTFTVPAGTPDGQYGNATTSHGAVIGGTPVTLPPMTDGLTVSSTLLDLTKAFTDDPVVPGGTVTLEFTLTNLSATETVTGIAFADNLDAALSGLVATGATTNTCGGMAAAFPTGFFQYSGGTLLPGASCTIVLSVDVPMGPLPGNVFPNTTTAVAGKVGALDVFGEAASDDLNVQTLTFSKSFDGPSAATRTAVLSFTIENLDSANAVGGLAFSDDLDAVIPGLMATSLPSDPCGSGSSLTGTSFLTLTGGSLGPAPGGICTFDVDVLVPAGAAPGTFPNATSDLFQNGLKVADFAAANLVVEPPPHFSKSFAPNAILAGGVSTLTFTIDNTASVLAASALDFTDNLPAGVVVASVPNASTTCTGDPPTAIAGAGTITYAGGSVAAGSSCTLSVDVTSVTAGAYVNTTGDLTSSSGSSGMATNSLTVNPAVDVSVTKTDGVTSATPGGSVTYTIVAANAGPSPDPSVMLSDTFASPPLTCTYTSTAAGGATGNTASGSGDLAETLSLPAGSSATYTVICAIDSDATGTLSNTASITPSITDTVTANNSATDNDTALVPSADLAITKTDSEDPVVNPTFTYTLEVTNLGPSVATGVEATDVLPAGVVFDSSTDGCTEAAGTVTCPFGTLGVGAMVTRTFVVALDPVWPESITNTATVSSENTDPNAGNNSSTEETALDAVPPAVTHVATAAGPLAECDTVRLAITSFKVTIADDLTSILNADDPANYLLVGAGADRDFSTIACSAAGDDVPIEIVTLSLASVDPVTVTATLGLGGALDPGLYRLLVCDTVTDTPGNALDGDGDASPGGDFVLTFRADPGNLFENGHFDDCPVSFNPWLVVTAAPNTIEPGDAGMDDHQASPLSASARISHSVDDISSLAQCVAVAGGATYDVESWLRFDPPLSATAIYSRTCEFFAALACTGAPVGTPTTASLIEDNGGAWELFTRPITVPAGARSALCDFTVEAVGSDPNFDVFLDGLRLIGPEAPIFADGFESGDTSAWSSTVP